MTQPNTPAHASVRHALPRGRAVLVGLLIVSLVAISRAVAAAPELSVENGDGVPWIVYMQQPVGASNVAEIQAARAPNFSPAP